MAIFLKRQLAQINPMTRSTILMVTTIVSNVLKKIFFCIFFAFFFRIFFAKKFQSHMGILGLFFFWKKHENEKIDFCQVLVWVCIKHWDIMKLASTWCVLDPERVCSELNELFFLNFTWKVHFMVQLLSYYSSTRSL